MASRLARDEVAPDFHPIHFDVIQGPAGKLDRSLLALTIETCLAQLHGLVQIGPPL